MKFSFFGFEISLVVRKKVDTAKQKRIARAKEKQKRDAKKKNSFTVHSLKRWKQRFPEKTIVDIWDDISCNLSSVKFIQNSVDKFYVRGEITSYIVSLDGKIVSILPAECMYSHLVDCDGGTKFQIRKNFFKRI